MQLDFSSYGAIVVDASLFRAALSETLLGELAKYQDRLYKASTFEVEADQFAQVMTPEQACIYGQNREALDKLDIQVLQHSSTDPSAQAAHYDVMELLTQASQARRSDWRILLLTENLNLQQRVIFRKLAVDIYDPFREAWLKQTEQLKDRCNVKFDLNDARLPKGNVPKGKKLTLYTEDRVPVKLEPYKISGVDAAGGEAKIYQQTDDPTMLAKIYKKPIRWTKYENVGNLAELYKTGMPEWVLLPQKQLYNDPDCTQFVGYLEKRAEVEGNLGNDALYTGSVRSLDPDHPGDYAEMLDKKYAETVILCLQIVRQVAYLRTYGICLTDYNTNNFSCYDPEYPWLYMWDTDSFCYGSYCSSFEAKDLITVNDYDTSTLSGIIDWSTEMFYLRILSLLTLGDDPLNHKTNTLWILDASNKEQRRLVPQNLLRLYERVFGEGKPLSVELLLLELDAAARMLREHPERDLSYGELLRQEPEVPKMKAPEVKAPEMKVPETEAPKKGKDVRRSAADPTFEPPAFYADLDDFFRNEPFPQIELSQTPQQPVQDGFRVASEPIPYKPPEPIPMGKKKGEKKRKKRHALLAVLLALLVLVGVGVIAVHVMELDLAAWFTVWAGTVLEAKPGGDGIFELWKLTKLRY